MKRQGIDMEKIFRNKIYDKELLTRICKELSNIHRKQPSWFLKGGQIHKTETSQRLNANRGEKHEKLFKIISTYRNTSLNHHTPVRILQNKNSDRDAEQLEISCVASGENTKWYSHIRKRFGSLFKKWSIHLPHGPAILLPGIYPREMKIHTHTKPVHKYL